MTVSHPDAPANDVRKAELLSTTVEHIDITSFDARRSEEHTSALQSLMPISYAVFCLKKKKHDIHHIPHADAQTKKHTNTYTTNTITVPNTSNLQISNVNYTTITPR